MLIHEVHKGYRSYAWAPSGGSKGWPWGHNPPVRGVPLCV